jgi:hypothetical protein
MGDNTGSIQERTKALIDASWKFGLEVNTEKTMYMSMSQHQNSGEDCNIKITSWER